jgi:hypothetical protein
MKKFNHTLSKRNREFILIILMPVRIVLKKSFNLERKNRTTILY